MKEPVQEEDEGFMRAEVIIICSFAVAVLLFLSNFGICGAVGAVLRGVQLGIFGTLGYVAPLILFVGTCFYLSNRGNLHAAIKLAAVIAAVITVCGLLQLLFGKTPQEAGFAEYYRYSSASGMGGGFIGGTFTALLIMAVGRVGTYLVLIVLFIICMVCITERSFVSVVKRGGDKAYRYAREDMDRRREQHAQRAEERRRLREAQKVSGVNLDATKLGDNRENDYPQDYDEEQFDREFKPDEEVPVERGKVSTVRPNPQEAAATSASTADLFTGTIHLPLSGNASANQNQDEDVSALASSLESHQRTRSQTAAPKPVPGQTAVSKTASTREARPAVTGMKVEDEFGIHEEEEAIDSFRVKRDRRTLEEMDMGRPSVKDDFMGRGGASGYDGPAPQTPVAQTDTVYNDVSDCEEDTAGNQNPTYSSHTEYAPVDDTGYRTKYDTDYQTEYTPVDDRESDTEYDTESEAGDNTGYDAGNDIGDDTEYNIKYNTEYDAGYDTRTDTEGDDDEYDTVPEEQGVNYDSIFVPEEPKRVVTAAGKVIETETELLQKKLEKKKEAAAPAPEPDSDAAVAQEIQKKEEEIKKEYVFPPTSLLTRGENKVGSFTENEYKATAIKLQQTLRNFGVGVTVTNVSCGPSVTRYELLPEQGVKVSKIVALTDDIKLSLAVADIRIEAPIPGKSAVGIEVPNKENHIVHLRELLEADAFKNHKSRLAFAVGKDIGGQVVVADIAKMPHLLIAGATGSGKSVCINTLIMSIIYKSKPEDVKLIMVDPKVVELSVYNGIPHLLIPVVTDPKKASGALNWAVAEMDGRYRKFAECNVRDLKGYNDRVDKIGDVADGNKPQKLPQIVIIIDELADLMMVAPGEVEDSICRLAQLARAAGIHLVIATQRPSVNVITGLIKANVPSRIAFAVSQGVDSRTIIDMNGAEKLLGKGDMLFYPTGYPKPQRVQGAFVSDEEVGAVVDFLKDQGMTAQYSNEVVSRMASSSLEASGGGERDEYFMQAGRFIIDKDKASIGMLQRMFKIGFNRAARIMDQLAEAGVVGEEEGTKPRKVLMSMEQFEELIESGG